MDEIKKLFENISDEELLLAVSEIKEDSESGIIREGVVRKYSKLACEMTNEPRLSTHLYLSEISILKQAAFRWLKANKT